MTDPPDKFDQSQLSGRLWLAEALWKLGSIQFGDFTLGRTVRNSPVYLNAKLLISRPADLRRTAQLIADVRAKPEAREGLSAFLEKRKASWS